MGRVKNTAIRKMGDDLIRANAKKFSTDFVKNKQALLTLKEIKSKRIINMLTGYITNEMQKIKKRGL